MICSRITVVRAALIVLLAALLPFRPVSEAAATAAEIKPHGDNLTGTIVEAMDVAGYTYLDLDTAAGRVWVAIPQTAVEPGEQVSCLPGMEMTQFYSKSLDKTFERIIFSEGIAGSLSTSPHRGATKLAKAPDSDSFEAAVQAEREAQSAETSKAIPSGGSAGAIAPFAEITVEKAAGDNSYTVAELHARAAELDGRKVRVRGKVVKYNANIMGRHWLHLQDGTGDPRQNTHDLVVTVTSPVEDPDILTVEGVLAADKDFGAGYIYEVIVEQGEILAQDGD